MSNYIQVEYKNGKRKLKNNKKFKINIYMRYIKPNMGYYDSLYKLNYDARKRARLQELNFLSHDIVPKFDLITIFLFLKKIELYEPAIYQKIRDLIGVPKMSVGSMFRFSNQYTYNLFRVVNVCAVSPLEQNYQEKKGMHTYKYGYTIDGYNGIKMLNYIYDSYIDAGYIVILS